MALGGEFGPNNKSRVAGFMSSGAVLMMPISFGWIEVPFGPGYGRSSFISSTLTSGLVSCIDMARGAMLSLILLLVQYDVRLARGRDYTLLAVDVCVQVKPIRYIANNR